MRWLCGLRFREHVRGSRSTKPGLAARDKENQKLNADACSSAPVAVRHRLVPCVVEEGGRIGGQLSGPAEGTCGNRG